MLFFAFANFYGQFVNLPLRGFEHDKLTLKSSRKRSGTEDGELKTKCRILWFLLPHFNYLVWKILRFIFTPLWTARVGVKFVGKFFLFERSELKIFR